MSEHRYPRRAIVADYARAATGAVLTGTPLAAASTGPVVGTLLGALLALFLGYGVRTGLRHASRVRLDEDAISLSGAVRKNLAWRDLARLEMRYYATTKDRKGGWMQLTLKADGRTIRIDSTIEGFEAILARAVRAARDNAIEIGPTTADNLKAFGFGAAGQGGPGTA